MVTESSTLTVDGQVVEPGTRAAIRVPVTTGLNGAEYALWVHVVRGRSPGPTLALLSGMHGGEWFSIEAVRRLVRETDPSSLRGAIVAAPTVNSPALMLNTRNMPDESDSPDMNRIFPGPLTWTSDQIVATLTREVLAPASCMLDFHMGPYGSAFQDILLGADFPDPEVTRESERLALAVGSPNVRRANVVAGFPGPRSSIGYCGSVLGIPALGVELGGLGFGPALEARWLDDTLAGIRAVMGALGMIDHAPDPRPARQLVYSVGHRVNPTKGGFLRSRFSGDKLGAAVNKGDLLGEIVSPYTFEVIEELRAPATGLLFYVARDYPVHPGDWAFGLANTERDARWVENAA
jgi:uncharacterized protein